MSIKKAVIENCGLKGTLLCCRHRYNWFVNGKMIRIFALGLFVFFISSSGLLSAQEFVKAPKGYVKYKLSNARKLETRYGESVIAFDYSKTQDGIGSARLVVRSDNGRMGVVGIGAIEDSGTIRLERSRYSISHLMGRSGKGIEFFFVSGDSALPVYSPYSQKQRTEILVSNVLQYGKLSSTVNVRAMTKEEKEEFEKDRLASLPPADVPEGYVRSDSSTKLLPGAKVKFGRSAEWQDGVVISVSSNRVKVLPDGAEFCRTIPLDKWLALSEETLSKMEESPDSFSTENLVLADGSVRLKPGMEPLTDAMNLFEGTPLFKDGRVRWQEVYF